MARLSGRPTAATYSWNELNWCCSFGFLRTMDEKMPSRSEVAGHGEVVLVAS